MHIYHTADFHLGRQFRDFPEAQETLSQARYNTLDTTVRQANEKQADLLAIAGDLFDRTSMNKREVKQAVQSINKFSGKAAIVLPGNHDYLAEGGDLWQWFKEEAEEHIIVPEKQEPVDLRPFGLEAIIYPGPCHAKHSVENAIGWVKDIDKDTELYHIGIAHGSIEGVSPDFEQRYFPMTQKELKEAGVDVWLLGHTHITWPEKPDRKDIIFNPGTPEPDGFGCPHEGRVFFLSLDKNKQIRAEIISTGQYRFEQLREQPENAQQVNKLVESITEGDYDHVVLQLTVEGRLDPEGYEIWKDKIAEIRSSVLELRLDDSNLVRRVTKEQIRQEFAEDSFPHKLLSQFEGEVDEQALQMAYELIREAGDER